MAAVPVVEQLLQFQQPRPMYYWSRVSCLSTTNCLDPVIFDFHQSNRLYVGCRLAQVSYQ